MPLDCAAYRDRLGELLEESNAAAPGHAELAAHVASCADCSRDLAVMRQAQAVLTSLPVMPAPPDLRARVRAQIEAAEARPPWRAPRLPSLPWLRPLPLAWGGGFALAALCLLLVYQAPHLQLATSTSQQQPAPAMRALPPVTTQGAHLARGSTPSSGGITPAASQAAAPKTPAAHLPGVQPLPAPLRLGGGAPPALPATRGQATKANTPVSTQVGVGLSPVQAPPRIPFMSIASPARPRGAPRPASPSLGLAPFPALHDLRESPFPRLALPQRSAPPMVTRMKSPQTEMHAKTTAPPEMSIQAEAPPFPASHALEPPGTAFGGAASAAAPSVGSSDATVPADEEAFSASVVVLSQNRSRAPGGAIEGFAAPRRNATQDMARSAMRSTGTEQAPTRPEAFDGSGRLAARPGATLRLQFKVRLPHGAGPQAVQIVLPAGITFADGRTERERVVWRGTSNDDTIDIPLTVEAPADYAGDITVNYGDESSESFHTQASRTVDIHVPAANR